MLRAKVFVSCGQKKETEEVEIAGAVANVLEDLGFEPYIAGQQHTLRGLKENIFSELNTSEYFLFVDFPREQFANSAEHRGSLFSHQELAIASYLDLPVIAFQQKGVKLLDGMMSALQVNAIPFDDAKKLPETVRKQINKAGWCTGWKNTLSIGRQPTEFDDADINNAATLRARYFHLDVHNLNRFRLALNCIAYVESIVEVHSGTPLPLRTVELKWAGYAFPYANILPGSRRQLDACYVLHNRPEVLHFSCFSDSGYFMRSIQGPGEFVITFVVVSENFPEARLRTTAHVGNLIGDATLT